MFPFKQMNKNRSTFLTFSIKENIFETFFKSNNNKNPFIPYIRILKIIAIKLP